MDNPYGLVLMGGRSTRMGEDKSQLDYHGQPQRDYLTALLAEYCPAVFWSVNAEQAVELTDYQSRLIVDSQPEAGPLGGILSAMAAHPDRAWLVVACDLPLLTRQTLTALLAGRDDSRPATAFWDADHRGPEPLVSLWEPMALPLLYDFFGTGQRSPRRFLAQHAGPLLTAPDVRELTNVNDPGTLAGVMHRLT
ncbi:MAG: NTP transferase domain-containing protein [Bacteroidetes bacterium]|nr:NTP transferase domain-containing protein [Fibrella sp.]